ncbi:MAG: 4Fe-4S binding protein [Spirochaetales bacterium]|uniref:dihydrouracil dehydrogenase (NAD(+)) n=1 Tax=Candidatus Thalassospirochaeta sargassi TaxID=3119039 RepID=A0AAJ1II09_9SPIO|nr:4Fe-4S binding protein [Spirochaetales bacterium]
MAELKTQYAGLELENPLIVSAGPWSRDTSTISKALESGASAVVTASIVSEPSPTHCPRLFYKEYSLSNIRLYSELTLEDWKKTIGETRNNGGTIIASIMGESPSELAYLAESVESFGANAIEIGAAAPFGEGLEIKCSDPEFVFNYTEAVTTAVKIPVAVKLSATVTNPVACARAAERGGASGISGIDSVRAFAGIDIETATPYLPSLGGLSGSSVRPVSMAIISMISEAVGIPVCGIGGISRFSHAVEYFMLGAQSVQIGSSILTNGYSNIGIILEELTAWLDNHNYRSIQELKGIVSKRISPFQDLRSDPLAAEFKTDCHKSDCMHCRNACTYDAISFTEGKINLNRNMCSGCGMCINVCPEKLISMSWYQKG